MQREMTTRRRLVSAAAVLWVLLLFGTLFVVVVETPTLFVVIFCNLIFSSRYIFSKLFYDCLVI